MCPDVVKTLCLSVLAIDEEWQRTQCMPRETCVDVAKELGTPTSMFFKPPCVSVHRFVHHETRSSTLLNKLRAITVQLLTLRCTKLESYLRNHHVSQNVNYSFNTPSNHHTYS